MRLLAVSTLIPLLLNGCGTESRKDPQPDPGIRLTDPKTVCTIDLAFSTDGIIEHDDWPFVQHAIYGKSKVSEGCVDLKDVDIRNLSIDLEVTAKPSNGYVYQIVLGDERQRFVPGIELKDGNLVAQNVGDSKWHGSLGALKEVAVIFGYRKRVETGLYPEKVALRIHKR